eukprot:Selendium_serpulae@DN4318_c0_g1_i5.p1
MRNAEVVLQYFLSGGDSPAGFLQQRQDPQEVPPFGPEIAFAAAFGCTLGVVMLGMCCRGFQVKKKRARMAAAAARGDPLLHNRPMSNTSGQVDLERGDYVPVEGLHNSPSGEWEDEVPLAQNEWVDETEKPGRRDRDRGRGRRRKEERDKDLDRDNPFNDGDDKEVGERLNLEGMDSSAKKQKPQETHRGEKDDDRPKDLTAEKPDKGSRRKSSLRPPPSDDEEQSRRKQTEKSRDSGGDEDREKREERRASRRKSSRRESSRGGERDRDDRRRDRDRDRNRDRNRDRDRDREEKGGDRFGERKSSHRGEEREAHRSSGKKEAESRRRDENRKKGGRRG